MAAFSDSVRFLATAGGTSDFVYSSTVQGYNGPADANVVSGLKYKLRAESADLSQWEVFEGVANLTGGVWTFPRTTVLFNSAKTGTQSPGQSGAGTKISFSAAPQVAIVALAEDLLSIEQGNTFSTAQRTQGRANLGAAINELQNVSFAVSAASGALTIALKDANGNDPTSTTPIALSFRNASLTASPNTPTILEVTAATSIVLPSTSTCGFASATAGRLWICGWNDGGTFRLGVFKASTASALFALVENGVGSSLQITTGSTSAGQHYTSAAAVTSRAFRILGYVDWSASGMTAGTWTITNLNSIVTFGPGIPLPGRSLQTQTFVMPSTSQSSTTSASFVATNTTVNIALGNAADIVRVKAFGTIRNTTASENTDVTLARGGTAIGAFTAARQDLAAANCWWPTSLCALDLPNSVSQQTYAVYFRNGAGGTSQWCNPPNATGNMGYIEADEIMG
jgi:hypothetical protein